MNNYGLSNAGFKTKNCEQIRNDIETNLKQEIDPSLRFTPDTVAGVLTGIIANQTRQVWETMQGLYNSLDPNAAQGRALDALCSLTGTYRQKPSHSRANLQVKLAGNATLPKGSMVAVKYNHNARFRTIAEVKNNSAQEALLEVVVEADEPGPVYAPASLLSYIITPQSGWLGAANIKEAIIGHLEETDEALRIRRLQELRATGTSTHEGLKAHLRAIDGVEAVYIEEGRHEFTAYIIGGDDAEIAQALWLYKPLAMQTAGLISQQVTATNGQTYTMRFSRAQDLLLTLNIEIKVKSRLDELEIADLKKQILINSRANLKLGDEVYRSRFYAILSDQPKILDVMDMKLEPTPKEVKPYERVIFSADKIFFKQIIEVAI